MAQDSSAAEFWDTRYRAGVTPWDAGGTPPALDRWLARLPAGRRVLVPGCGSGHEIAAFHRAGHEVLGIDFSSAALEAARVALGPLSRLVRQADFFLLEEGAFDVVYERALLCALPRARWDDWGRRMAALVRPGGVLAGLFYFDDNPKGPPFGIRPERLDELLLPAFERVEDGALPPGESLPVFHGRERWQAWKRRL